MKKFSITLVLIVLGLLNGAAIYNVCAGPVGPPSDEVVLEYPYQTMGKCGMWNLKLMCTKQITSKPCQTHCYD